MKVVMRLRIKLVLKLTAKVINSKVLTRYLPIEET